MPIPDFDVDNDGDGGSGDEGTSAGQVTRQVLRRRYDSYLIGHYLSLHVTIVSVTLAVAGLAAAALLAPSAHNGSYQPLLWVLWGASLLAAADAYAGPMTGAVILPPGIPSAVDLVLPLLLGVCEFVMFSILGSQGAGAIPAQTVVTGWWFAFAAFAVIAAGSVARAIQIINGVDYEGGLEKPVGSYLRAERRDLRMASIAAGLSTAAGILHLTDHTLSLAENYALAALTIVMLVGGFIDHRLAARSVRAAIQASTAPMDPGRTGMQASQQAAPELRHEI